MRRRTLTAWKTTRQFDEKLQAFKSGGTRIENKIGSIDEASQKLEASYESCVIDFIESGPHNRYSPDRYALSLYARKGK